MQRIDKIIVKERRETAIEIARRQDRELKQAIHNMTTEQLRELADGSPSDERVAEIFASVGALHLVEGG